MYPENIRVKIITAVLFILQQNYLCYTDSDNLNALENNIITDIIPPCVFGVESVSYFLYTRDKPYGKEIRMDDEYIPMRADKKVAFLIHGFISEANNSNYFELITAWLKKDDINIFSLDWSDAACRSSLSFTNLFTYGSAVDNIPVVSRYLTNFTVVLVHKYGVKVNEIVVVGHSLGAHIAGFFGKHIQDIFQQKYKHIIGLDPAGPKFSNKDCAQRLCKTDAAFVQIFHTSYLAGIHDAIGVDDFYFNGGNSQPGCTFTVCSHSRAVKYLTETILHSQCFIGTQWENWFDSILNWGECNPTICSHPGLDTPEEKTTGSFYVATESTEPYCTL
ncbi:Phospholipase A1 [Anthophora plagiata]